MLTFENLIFTYIYLAIYWVCVGPRTRWLIYGALFFGTGSWLGSLNCQLIFHSFCIALGVSNPLLRPLWRLVALSAYIRRDRY